MQQDATTFGDFLNLFILPFFIVCGVVYKFFITALKEPDTKQEYIAKLKKFHFLPFYRYWLKNILNKIDKYLGKPKFSKDFILKNISLHYGFAVLYLFVVFLIIWLLGGNNTIGALEILPKKDTLFDRLIVLGVILLIGIAMLYIYNSKILDIYNKKINNFFKIYVKIILLIITVIPTVAIVKTVVVSVIIGTIIGSLGGKGGRGRRAILLRWTGGIVFIGILGTGVPGVINLLQGNNFFNMVNSSLLIFFVIIPFLNAILDFISLTVSRYFSQKIADGESILLIIFHLLLDLILAVIFLIGLAYILYYGIELFNALVDKKLQIPIKEMLTDTIKEPFALKNAWITFMLLSTLIPTLLHILLAITTFLLQITNLSPFYAKLIEESEERETKKIKAALIMAVPISLIFMLILYGVYRLYLLFI